MLATNAPVFLRGQAYPLCQIHHVASVGNEAVYLLQRRQISYLVHSYAGTDKAAGMQSRATSSANRPPSRSVRVDLRE